MSARGLALTLLVLLAACGGSADPVDSRSGINPPHCTVGPAPAPAASAASAPAGTVSACL